MCAHARRTHAHSRLPVVLPGRILPSPTVGRPRPRPVALGRQPARRWKGLPHQAIGVSPVCYCRFLTGNVLHNYITPVQQTSTHCTALVESTAAPCFTVPRAYVVVEDRNWFDVHARHSGGGRKLKSSLYYGPNNFAPGTVCVRSIISTSNVARLGAHSNVISLVHFLLNISF